MAHEYINPLELNLYVIERESGGELQYWTRSGEHGCGWGLRVPKQAWSKSEVANEVRWMAEHENWTDVKVRQLSFASDFYLVRGKWYGCRDEAERWRALFPDGKTIDLNVLCDMQTPTGTFERILEDARKWQALSVDMRKGAVNAAPCEGVAKAVNQAMKDPHR